MNKVINKYNNVLSTDDINYLLNLPEVLHLYLFKTPIFF
jgi:hypothetical protein